MTRLLTFVSLLLIALPSHAAEPASLQSHIQGDRVLGNANAKVTLIEYASLSCPHCASFHNTVLPAIKREYIDTGKVRLIFRDYPLNEPALHAAKLAHCASEQGGDAAYFKLLQAFFETQQSWAFDQQFASKLTQIAAAQKLDASKLEKCRDDKSLEEKILTTRKDGSEKMKVTATPSFFINGEAAADVGSIETMRKALDTVLGGKSLSQAAREEAKRITSVQAGDMVLGKRTAKITLVEFINIGCPHCADFHKRLVSALQKDYLDTGKVKLVYRPMLLSPATFYANMIASCRSDQQFFATLDVLIDNVQGWSSTPAYLTPLREAAEKAGIAAAEFYPCLENKDREARILGQHRDASERLGLRHSPSLYLNGESIEANDPVTVTRAIDQLLAKKP